MRKFLLLLTLTIQVLSVNGQSRWNIAAGTGAVTNISKFKSGNEEANALFSSNPVQSHNINVNFRYRICDRMSFQTGVSFAKIGYSYSIAKDYSLLKPRCNNDDIHSGSYMTSIPAMVVINTRNNCNNMRFIFGAGISVRGTDNSWNSTTRGEIKSYEAANTNDTYITAQSATKATLSPAATWMIGMERIFPKGNSLVFAFQGNQGFTTISESTVSYTVNNKDYTHTFINRGSFAVLSLTYNFAAFGSGKLETFIQ